MGFEQPMPHFGMETQLGAATLAPSGFVGQLLLALAVVDVGHLGRVRTGTACGAGSRELRSICAAQEELDAYFHEDLRRVFYTGLLLWPSCGARLRFHRRFW